MERLNRIDSIRPRHASQVASSQLGIGFEKLDRNVFDPSKAYDKIAALGVKWVRLQSGWARTEKEKGVYDFQWLDEIVRNLHGKGMQPWICLCYGNGLYTPEANKYFGAVGCPPINSQEALSAWQAYVSALVSRYRDQVSCYEVWNEPDGAWCWKHGPSGSEYGQFVAATAQAVRRANPEARVFGGSVYAGSLGFLQEAMQAGMAESIDALTFHCYTTSEEDLRHRTQALRALCDSYSPNIALIQGESGSQSDSRGAGALRGAAWTPLRQAKQLLRHAVGDLINGVEFSSYFSSMDMIEALNGLTGDKSSYQDYGYFGVLGADFDEDGFASGEYTPKPSYYAYQNLAALLADSPKVSHLPYLMQKGSSPRVLGQDYLDYRLFATGFAREGSSALCYWHPAELLTQTFESTISLEIAGQPAPIRLVDPMDGAVYALPDSMVEQLGHGCVLLRHLPIRDYPLFLCFGDFVAFDPTGK